MFVTFFDAGFATLAHILSTSPLFVSFAIFRTGSEVKKRMFLVIISAILKSFLKGEIYISSILKWLQKLQRRYFFLSSHKHTNSAFCSGIPFFHCLSLFQDFIQKKTHTAKISFWFLEKEGPTIDSIYGAPQDCIDTTVLSRLFPLL